jgi:hypothetical protein
MRFSVSLAFATLAVAAVPAYGANDCKATVAFVSAAPKGSGVELTFDVATQCDASVGRFGYTYESSARPGVPVERNAPSWRAGDGKAFKWTDDLPSVGGAVISKIKVIPRTIESTKL